MADEIIIYKTDDGNLEVKLFEKDGAVWMNQMQMAQLFETTKQNISLHVSNILSEGELNYNSVVKNYLTTAPDGKQYNTTYYALPMILAVGFRVRSVRGVQFRIWANEHLIEFLRKGFILDDERLKNPGGRYDYFDELLERIRDIRASEKRFYQKIRDLFALSSDYSSSDETIQSFFAQTQNKLIYAVTLKTAPEIIAFRADSSKPNMNLTSWKGKVVRKSDIYISKNYLTKEELDTLNRLVIIFLDSAELQVKMRKDLKICFWKDSVDKILADHNFPILESKSTQNRLAINSLVEKEYIEFDKNRKQFEAQEADIQEVEELKELEKISEKLKKK